MTNIHFPFYFKQLFMVFIWTDPENCCH